MATFEFIVPYSGRVNPGAITLEGTVGYDRILFDNTTSVNSYGLLDLREVSITGGIEEIAFDATGYLSILRLAGRQFDGPGEFASDLLIRVGTSVNTVASLYIELGEAGDGNNLDMSGWTFVDWEALDPADDFLGRDGNEIVVTGTTAANIVHGSSKNDEIVGNGGDDVLYGGDGNDKLIGGYSHINYLGDSSTYYGGAGDDRIEANGEDILFGGTGDDTLAIDNGHAVGYGGSGDDGFSLNTAGTSWRDGGTPGEFYGGAGKDYLGVRIYGDATANLELGTLILKKSGITSTFVISSFENISVTPGANANIVLTGTAGDNSLGTGSGHDRLYGGDGNDRFVSGYGDDIVHGGDGNDLVYAGSGLDLIYGGAGNDDIDGGSGKDFIYGGDDDDLLHGDDNASTYAHGADRIFGGAGNDTAWGDGGNDRIWTGEGADEVYGGLGNDIVGGGSGRDTIHGDDGNDRLNGDNGNDVLYGGEGDDILEGGSRRDVIYGGNGNDTIYGGVGIDRLDGGYGADQFVYDDASWSTSNRRDLVLSTGASAFANPGDAAGDLFDLSGMDADTTEAGNQAFSFGGSEGAGPLDTSTGHFWFVNEGTHTLLRANNDADAAVDFEVAIRDFAVLASAYNGLDVIG